jgi:hypothetical protein
MKRKRPFYNIGLIGLGVGLLAIAMWISSPDPLDCATPDSAECVVKPPGFQYLSIVACIEFATSTETLHGVLAHLPAEQKGKLDVHLATDYFFLILYVIFILGFSLRAVSESLRNSFLVAGIFGLVAGVFDVLENLEITKIVAAYEPVPEFTYDLWWMHVTTWTKWGALAMVYFIMFFYFRKGFNLYQKALGYLGLIPIVLGVAAYFIPELLVVWFVKSVTAYFFFVVIYALFYKKPNSNLRFF